MSTVLAFFGLALPYYAYLRKKSPENDWTRGGNVSTSAIQPLDLVIVGGYVLMYVLLWKSYLEVMEKAGEVELTAGKIVGSMLGMIFMAGVVPGVLFWRADLREFFGLRWPDWKKVFWIAPAFVFGFFVLSSILIALGWQEWVQSSLDGKPQNTVALLNETPDVGLLVVMAFSAVVIAPITEEVIFRGYLYPVVKHFSDRWFAAVFTGVFFGVIHLNAFSLPALAVMGFTLVVLYEVTGSLWVTIACHAAFNGTSVGLILLSRVVEIPS